MRSYTLKSHLLIELQHLGIAGSVPGQRRVLPHGRGGVLEALQRGHVLGDGGRRSLGPWSVPQRVGYSLNEGYSCYVDISVCSRQLV